MNTFGARFAFPAYMSRLPPRPMSRRFIFLLFRIFFFQTVGYEKYRDKVLSQITTEVEVVAERGYQASIEGPGFGLPGYGTETDELV